MWIDVAAKFEQAAASTDARIALRLNPQLTMLPLPIGRFDEPFFPLGKTVIQATHKRVSAYLFDFAAYLALGAAGVIALERTIAYANSLDRVTILDGPFSGSAYRVMLDELSFNLDAVTLADAADLPAYSGLGHGAAFVNMPGTDEQPVPDDAGLYYRDQNALVLPDTEGEPVRFSVAGDDVVYADRGYDFADHLLQRLDVYR